MRVRGETVMIRHQTEDTYDKYNRLIPGKLERVPVNGCVVAQRGSSITDASGVVGLDTNELTVFFPKRVDLSGVGEVEIRGLIFRLDGVPSDHVSAFGSKLGGTMINVKRVTA